MAVIEEKVPYPTPLTALIDAIIALARARSEEEIVETIRSTARSLIGCEGIAIIRREGDLCHYVEEDAIGPLWKGQKFPAVACISGWSMINREAAIVPDISKDPRIPYELYEETFVRAVAMVPVREADPVGAIGAYWSQPYEPAEWEVDVLQALANAAARGLENARFIASLTSIDRHDVTGQPVADDNDEALFLDVDRVKGIAVVPMILDVALRMTGMGFAAVTRVTETRWIACQVLDQAGFGLKAGSELPVESTLCNEVRKHREVIAFDDATIGLQYNDPRLPRNEKLRSYISVPIIATDGTVFGTLCALDARPAKVNNSQVIGAFRFFADLIAQQLDVGERLEAAQALLRDERSLAELREQFIGMLAHELRNPIAALNAGTSRLLREGWTDRSPMILKLMMVSIDRMSGIVDNVLDLARARLGGGIVLSRSEGDLVSTLTHVVDELRYAHPEREVIVDFDIDKPVTADHPRFAQMVSNLVTNALMHGSTAEPIRIGGYVGFDEIVVFVRNGGTAIAADQIERIFEPFQRGEATTTTQGLGLGLYIASEIAKAHGGRIEVRSDPDETCFTVRMPA